METQRVQRGSSSLGKKNHNSNNSSSPSFFVLLIEFNWWVFLPWRGYLVVDLERYKFQSFLCFVLCGLMIQNHEFAGFKVNFYLSVLWLKNPISHWNMINEIFMKSWLMISVDNGKWFSEGPHLDPWNSVALHLVYLWIELLCLPVIEYGLEWSNCHL